MKKVNLNTADICDLCQIKHVGQVVANRIIDARNFKDVYELSKVKGLGDKRMTDILEEGVACV
jgi:DNA uptake protein ComE-like DNA-binding protein